ncbi:hypothetical protein EIN_172490 [Entamoeba invadens IP1]|uniref:TFIIE beta domain-containing protein n=1 Tax=Entamoeba invadens IP1 TaxID=370355 RepID=A0A0A1TVT4_ENTIV|nr:hypothetical protein EIN_172490 [Entamoeba invadens IP1]ELP84614.1 hypothetical protein EIN_172490 [Entamoeba invadens IP1]|eukprot:XP_004183960.1 hypothetical protein EIN_172490 [Entamoeba invadens IP1]
MNATSIQTHQSNILEYLKKNRNEFTSRQILEILSIDLQKGGELFNRLIKMEQIEYNETKETFKYKPKCNARNFKELQERIHTNGLKGVSSKFLNDAYPGVEEDLKQLQTHPSDFDMICLKEDKGKDVFFFSDPTKKVLGGGAELDGDIVSKWKQLTGSKDDDFDKTIRNSNLIRYHFSAQNTSKRSKKDL